jgi:site-specific recombinase XerC
MATVYRKRPGDIKWSFAYTDENGRRVVKAWSTDYNETAAEAVRREKQVELIRLGYVKREDIGPAEADKKPIGDHVAEWEQAMLARGRTAKHAELFTFRVRNLFKEAGIIRLSDLKGEAVQKALAALGNDTSERRALSKATLNRYLTATRAFINWLVQERLRQDPLTRVKAFNAKEDERHQRRTLGAEELQALVQAALSGPTFRAMTGPARALLYRVVFSTGLRFSEIESATTHSFDLDRSPPTVRVAAAYTKNGNEAVQPLPLDIAADLRSWLAARPAGAAAFDMPHGRGARMLRFDLEAAGVPYRDAAGRVFDFHALRCQFATELDRQGTPPRVVQRLMRHATLEQSDRYTRPRAVDLERAVAALPSFRPDPQKERQALRATGTDPRYQSATTAADSCDSKRPASHLTHVEQRCSGTCPNRVRASRSL